MKNIELHKCSHTYKAECPNCGQKVTASFNDSPVLTTICPKCDYCILEDEANWRKESV